MEAVQPGDCAPLCKYLCVSDRAHLILVEQIGMFDRDHTGTVNFEEFKHLWKYVTDWLNW